jgi:hypothetical protein
MNHLILRATSLAQWYSLVNEAEDYSGKHLDPDLESYLVYMLQHYTDKPEVIASILAFDYLNSIESTGKIKENKLREVGDKSLLFSGFFPELAAKRHVTVSYFVEIGRKAYNYLSALCNQELLNARLYALLREHFINLLDLLFSIRDLSGGQQALTLIQAEELWRNTGSCYAYKVLKRHNKKIIAVRDIPVTTKMH